MSTQTFEVRFASDWGIGTGGGRHGEVDRMIRRDPAGLPLVPGKTLLAALRDAGERLAWGLDAGRRGPWHAWVEAIFGSQPGRKDDRPHPVDALRAPRPGALLVTDARMPQSEGASRPASPECGRPGWTVLKPGVAIDPETGVARDKHLRIDEVARGGVTLAASGEWVGGWGDSSTATAEAFLSVACGLIERMGSKRRRGHGRCTVTLRGVDRGASREVLERDAPPAPPPAMARLAASVAAPVSGPLGWQRQHFLLETLAPVIVPQAVLGNVVTCDDRVPGTYLLGWLGRALGAAGWTGKLLDEIAAGRLVITHATAEVAGTRGLPVPMAFFKEKEGAGLPEVGTVAARCDVLNRLTTAADVGVQLKGLRAGWVSDAAAAVWPWYEDVTKSLVHTTHNTVDDRVQRPTEAVGGVYTYQAIPAGTRLRFEVRWAGGLPDRWWIQAAERVRLGRAKRGEYGRARVSVASSGSYARDLDTALVGDGAPVLTVWLLSELLVRDEGLRPTSMSDGLRAALERELQRAAAGLRLVLDDREGVVNAILKPARVDSWHAGWQLPRPSLVGIAAGGVARYRVTGVTPENVAGLRKALVAIEDAGLGERRAEGYGQLRFDDPRLTAGALTLPTPIGGGATAGGALPAPPDIAIREARLERAALLGMAADGWAALGGGRRVPTSSQLGGLRAAATRLKAVGASEANPLQRWLASVKKTPSRTNAWPSEVLAKLGQLATQPDEVAKLVGEASLAPEDAALVLRAFIGGVLRTKRREREQEAVALPAPVQEAQHGT